MMCHCLNICTSLDVVRDWYMKQHSSCCCILVHQIKDSLTFYLRWSLAWWIESVQVLYFVFFSYFPEQAEGGVYHTNPYV